MPTVLHDAICPYNAAVREREPRTHVLSGSTGLGNHELVALGDQDILSWTMLRR